MPVPRDYDRPQGKTIRIALSRIPASGPAKRYIGSLLWDAGGPGGVSTGMIDDMAGRLSPAIRSRFDFVAFDPRGVGASRPALTSCGQPWPVRPVGTSSPDWATVQRRSAALLRTQNRDCLAANRRIARVMGTTAVADDLDRIRVALGDQKLNFWATSYGTRIGYVYALRYPTRVRALVLDGNIDPSRGYRALASVGGTAQDSALDFMKRHDRSGYDAIIATADSLTASPIVLADGAVFSRWDWLDLVGEALAFPAAWAQIAELATAVEQARGSDEQAEAIRARLQELQVRPNSNEGGVFSVVNCLDYQDWLSPRQQIRLVRANASGERVFGGSLTTMYAVGCTGLGNLTAEPIPLVDRSDQRALARVPAVVANATHDGATPMAWAKSMAKAFGGRPIIGYRSSEHVIWGAVDSRCVNNPIDRFMLTTKEPSRARVCAFVPPTDRTTPSSVQSLTQSRIAH